MSELSLTIYAMTMFTLAFLVVALVEEWRNTRSALVPRTVRIAKPRTSVKQRVAR